MALFKRNTGDKGRNTSDNPDEFRLTLVEHLEELRDRIIRSLVVAFLGGVVGWFILPYIYGYLNEVVYQAIKPAIPKGAIFKEVFHGATEPFLLQFKLSTMIGIGIAFPYIIMQIWGFIAPGLKPNERKPFQALAPWSAFLFFLGAGFAWIIVPSALHWFATYWGNFPGTDLLQEAGSMVFFILKMLIAFGFAFQLPLIVYALGSLDLLSAETLMKYWRQSATSIFVVAMIVTPSNDPISMLMMAIPLVLLFSISVYAVKFTQKKKKAAKEAEEVFRGGDDAS